MIVEKLVAGRNAVICDAVLLQSYGRNWIGNHDKTTTIHISVQFHHLTVSQISIKFSLLLS